MLELAELKKKHPVVMGVEINGLLILFRPLSRREFDTYLTISSSGLVPTGKIEDKIFREVVLDEGLIDRMYQLPAGIVPSVVGVVMRFSGRPLNTEENIDAVNADLYAAREAVQANIWDQYTAIICAAFPSYTPDQIEDKSLPEFYRLLMMAEIILKPEEPFQLRKVEPKKDRVGSYFEDAKKAKQVDSPNGPSNLDIRDELQKAKRPDLGTAMAREIETVRQAKTLKRLRDKR